MREHEFLALVVLMTLAIMLFPYLQNEISGVDTSTWNFTGSEAVENFLPLIPFFFLMGMIIIPVYLILTNL